MYVKLYVLELIHLFKRKPKGRRGHNPHLLTSADCPLPRVLPRYLIAASREWMSQP